MSDEKDRKSFWASAPGILTALAALITIMFTIWTQISTVNISFEASPPEITIGDSAILSWTTNCRSVSITPGNEICDKEYCEYNGTDSVEFYPKEIGSKFYKIKATKLWIIDGTNKTTITVKEPGPEAIGTFSPINPKVGELITFNASQSKDDRSPITYWKWDFGDDNSKEGLSVDFRYWEEGIYNVKLTVTNNKHLSNYSFIKVEVTNPKAIGTFSPANPKVGEVVAFDASQSKDDRSEITNYEWDFGDGTDPENGTSVDHEYLEEGTYKVKLTVINAKGVKDSSSIEVEVTNPEAIGATSEIEDYYSITFVKPTLKYKAKFFASWDVPGIGRDSWKSGELGANPFSQTIKIPTNATDIKIVGQLHYITGWHPRERNYPSLENSKEFKLTGDLLKMNLYEKDII